jgi:hypothetical protein
VAARHDGGLAIGRRDEVGPEMEQEARLVDAGMEGDPFLGLLRLVQALESLPPASENGDEAPEMSHPPAVGVVEEVGGLIEGTVVKRRAVHVDDEHPAKSLFA